MARPAGVRTPRASKVLAKAASVTSSDSTAETRANPAPNAGELWQARKRKAGYRTGAPEGTADGRGGGSPAQLSHLEPRNTPATRCAAGWRSAKARWRAEHQGEDPDKAGLRVIIVGWGAPQP